MPIDTIDDALPVTEILCERCTRTVATHWCRGENACSSCCVFRANDP